MSLLLTCTCDGTQAAARPLSAGEHLVRCTVNAHRRSSRQRKKALQHLRWRDGTHWAFGAQRRATLPAATLVRVSPVKWFLP